jgi:hypothetical protein
MLSDAMTLVLAWKTVEGITVIADTRFGGGQTVSEAGPKIFSVPITLNKWRDGCVETEKRRLPHMGFAFAGNTFAGQTAHSLATTCLGNLVTYEFDDGPTVTEVADFYGRCSKLVVEERRRWIATDAHCFEFMVFGRSEPRGQDQAFVGEVYVDAEGKAGCKIEEIDFSIYGLYLLGDGEAKVREIVEAARGAPTVIRPGELLQQLIDDSNFPTIKGNQQLAVVTSSGVEIRPVMRVTLEAVAPEMEQFGQQEIEYQIMGFELGSVGQVGRYSPTATHAVLR